MDEPQKPYIFMVSMEINWKATKHQYNINGSQQKINNNQYKTIETLKILWVFEHEWEPIDNSWNQCKINGNQWKPIGNKWNLKKPKRFAINEIQWNINGNQYKHQWKSIGKRSAPIQYQRNLKNFQIFAIDEVQ